MSAPLPDGHAPRREHGSGEWLAYAALCAVVWLVHLLAFWPGVMNPDAIDQWGQMLSGKFNDWHPAFHTLTNWVLTRLWLSPAAVAWAQVLAASALVGWGIGLLRAAGVSRWAAWLVCVVIAVLPANGYLMVNIGKDVPYTLSLLALTLLFFRVVLSRGAWLDRRGAWMWLGLAAALAGLYRHNGGLASVALIPLAVAYRARWRPVAGAVVLALGLMTMVRGPLYRALDIQSAPIWLAPLIHQVAAHVAGGTVPPQTREYLRQIRAIDDGWGYRWATINSTLFDPKAPFTWQVVTGDPRRFVRTWWRLTRDHPGVTLRHLERTSSLVWSIRQPVDDGWGFWPYPLWVGNDVVITIAANDLGLERRSKLPGVMNVLLVWLVGSQNVSWLLLRPALPLYLGFAGLGFLAVRTREWRALLIGVPLGLHSLVLMSTTLVQELRFQYPAYLVGWLLAGLLFTHADPRPESAAASGCGSAALLV